MWGAHIRSSSSASHVSPKAGGQGWEMLGTASAFLSCPETEAQSWGNEAATATDTDNINRTLLRACSMQVPNTLQSASHALPYLNRKTALQVGVVPPLRLRRLRLREARLLT